VALIAFLLAITASLEKQYLTNHLPLEGVKLSAFCKIIERWSWRKGYALRSDT